jgi:hypothetical protein
VADPAIPRSNLCTPNTESVLVQVQIQDQESTAYNNNDDDDDDDDTIDNKDEGMEWKNSSHSFVMGVTRLCSNL